MTKRERNALDLAVRPNPPSDPSLEELEHAALAVGGMLHLIGAPLLGARAKAQRTEGNRHMQVIENFIESEKRRQGLRKRLDTRA